MEIKAALLTKPKGEFKIENVKLDTTLRPNEVLVRIVATGICHTDLGIRDQHYPFPIPAILGHEGSGIVEKIGSGVTNVVTGDHVVLVPGNCGKCKSCMAGKPTYCEQFFPLNFKGTRVDGTCPYHDHNDKNISGFFLGQSSFATYSLTAENNLVKVSKDIPLDMLGPLGCGLHTGAGSVFNVFNPSAGTSIIVSGTGAVGMGAIMAAKASGCTTIIAVDLHDHRLALAKEMGATHTINSKGVSISEEARKIVPYGTDFSVDTTGINTVITEILKSMQVLGKCVILALPSAEKLELDQFAIVGTGRSIQYTINGNSIPHLLVPKLIELYQQGLFPFDKLIKYYELDQFTQAVEDTEKGVTLKAIVRMPK